MTSNTLLVILCLTVVLFLSPYMSSAWSHKRAFWICSPCENDDECNQPPQGCIYGETRDACSRRVCSKGPGEKCGGPLDYLGKCSSELMCKGQKCFGCHMDTGECHTL